MSHNLIIRSRVSAMEYMDTKIEIKKSNYQQEDSDSFPEKKAFTALY